MSSLQWAQLSKHLLNPNQSYVSTLSQFNHFCVFNCVLLLDSLILHKRHRKCRPCRSSISRTSSEAAFCVTQEIKGGHPAFGMPTIGLTKHCRIEAYSTGNVQHLEYWVTGIMNEWSEGKASTTNDQSIGVRWCVS